MPKNKRVTNLVEKVTYIEPVWEILLESYKSVSGGLLFSDKYDLLHSTSMWKIVLKKGKVIAVTIFKAKHGLKLVAMGADKITYGKKAVIALSRSIEEDLNHIWMEVSGIAENFLMTHCNAYRYIINNTFANTLLGKELTLDTNGYHYSRKIANIQKSKIIVGTPATLEFSKVA